MVSIQNGSKQDFFVQEQLGDINFLGVMDGHGGNQCIEFVRKQDFNFIASQPDPAQALWDIIQSSGMNFARSGCTGTFARVNTKIQVIEVWNVGDSATCVYLNDEAFWTEAHTFHNLKELQRTKPLVDFIHQTTAPTVSSSTGITDLPSFTGYFKNGDILVPSQSFGHNGVTGFDPHKQVIHYKSTDRVRIVCVSDGVLDMQVDLSTGTAEDIANEADRKWKQGWTYKGFPGIQFQNVDDISAVVWEKPAVEWPTICIPYSISIFAGDDVRAVFHTFGNIRKIDEFIVQKVRKIGWQYDRWDGTGDYYEFAKDEIDTPTALSLSTFLQSLA